jgi:hypothetical protein
MPGRPYTPQRLVLVDVDGLRADAFRHALESGELSHLGRLLGGPRAERGICFPAVSTAPSMTYCCQASGITGAHPRDHWIPGNHFFDRFGRITGGVPRKFEFDFVDAPAVFLQGLAGEAINPAVPTLYETAAEHGFASTVVYHMYAHGAPHWLKPGLDDWRAFVAVDRAGFGERYDNAMVADAIRHLREGHRPNLLTLYFFGLDHESHLEGPAGQQHYLASIVDRQVGTFLQAYEELGLLPDTLFVLFSDHGQKEVVLDDRHKLQVGFLWDRELGLVFEALGTDVYDHPLEGRHCEAVVSPCGAMAHIYLRRQGRPWADAPSFDREVLLHAQAFWAANDAGAYCAELQGAMSMVMVRDVEREGWYADYRVYTPHGLVPIDDYLAAHPEIVTVDAANRLHCMAGPVTGDLLLFTNYEQGYHFAIPPYRGIHGGLHPDDSLAVLAYGLPEGPPEQVEHLRCALTAALADRCRAEGGRQVGTVDMAYGVRVVMGWEEEEAR